MVQILPFAQAGMNDMSDAPGRKKSDLGERTARFGQAVLGLAEKTPDVTANRP